MDIKEENKLLFNQLTESNAKLLEIQQYCINCKEIKTNEEIIEILNYILKIIN